MKRLLLSILKLIVNFLGRFNGGLFILDNLVELRRETSQTIKHKETIFQFATSNRLAAYRADSFSSKEPETLEWIDALPMNCIIWDVGANVGLYSIYAAKTRSAKVYAFEPSVFNLELLARNIHLNKVTENVCIVPLALSSSTNVNYLRMTTTEWGGALSTFEKDFGWDGQKLQVTFDYQMVGICMDDVENALQIPQPEYIKMDVDGIEHFILQGGEQVLKKVKGVLIEVNDSFQQQAEICNSLLSGCGLTLIAKKHSAEYADSTSFGGGVVWNQIWARL